MTAFDDALAVTKTSLAEEATNGQWHPEPGDALFECEFIRAGFRSYGLEAPDKSWRLTVSRLDFGASNPTAILEVRAPNHDASFPDLGGLVFNHSVGLHGGTNFNQCVTRLHETLGGAKLDWAKRITYLMARAKDANAGGGNGTFATTTRPVVGKTPPFIFASRVREGRTMSIFGPGSAGKTTFVDGLIVAACSGAEIVPGWWPTREYCCLVLDWDEGREEEEVRLAAMCNAYQVELTGGYHYKRMSRPLSDVADEVGAYIVANEVEIVVVSPVGRAQRDHGDNLTAPIDELYEILRSFGTTNILIDHVTGANMKGGAEREFGSVRKRDNARGSYSLYSQAEGVGERTVVLRNMKADALSPRIQPQAIRIEYDPPESADGIYERIVFYADEVIETVSDSVTDRQEPVRLKNLIYEALEDGHLSIDQISAQVGYSAPTIKRVLYRYAGRMFQRLPSSRWERLPWDPSDTLGDSR